jgi:transposase-like protein
MKWRKSCPSVVESLEEGGDELFTFFRFPKAQWKTLRTTNAIERLNGESRRRVKTQCNRCTRRRTSGSNAEVASWRG